MSTSPGTMIILFVDGATPMIVTPEDSWADKRDLYASEGLGWLHRGGEVVTLEYAHGEPEGIDSIESLADDIQEQAEAGEDLSTLAGVTAHQRYSTVQDWRAAYAY